MGEMALCFVDGIVNLALVWSARFCLDSCESGTVGTAFSQHGAELGKLGSTKGRFARFPDTHVLVCHISVYYIMLSYIRRTGTSFREII